jgi:glycosyltransferase involved in cell wall biosynthesis
MSRDFLANKSIMRIRLIGQRNNLGIGIHYANFCDQIKKIYGITVEEIDIADQTAIDRAVGSSQDTDINICFVAANVHEVFKGKIIQYIVFETDRIADHILSTIRHADAVWVPSAWGQDILKQHGVESTVVPEGVDADLYNPYSQNKQDRPFRFLTVGKFEGRKSIRETIQAFAKEFGNDSTVELYIKTGHYADDPARLEELKQYCDSFNLDNLIVYWGNYEPMVNLYRSSDVFVLPTKGEAWGLPIIEAAASGLPIITVLHSGHTEYLRHILSSVVSIGFEIVPVDCPDFLSAYPGDCGRWAQPDVEFLGGCMRTVYNNHQSYKESAVRNSALIRTAFSWQRSVDCALESVAKIQQT